MSPTVQAVRDTDVVPRRLPRQPGPDDYAAERILFERVRRGWSQGELARRVTESGASIRQQTIWQIESAEPRRKISYGEAIAFCQVFGIEDVAELGQPAEATAAFVLRGIWKNLSALHEDAEKLAAALADFRELSSDYDPVHVRDLLQAVRKLVGEIDAEVAATKAFVDSQADLT